MATPRTCFSTGDTCGSWPAMAAIAATAKSGASASLAARAHDDHAAVVTPEHLAGAGQRCNRIGCPSLAARAGRIGHRHADALVAGGGGVFDMIF